jgi:hypothetical protein
MNDDSASDDLKYAIREYNRILEEAKRGERPFDREATLRAIAGKTGVTVEELQRAIPA